jgi:HlyD family type I secretion membrane fusion protein
MMKSIASYTQAGIRGWTSLSPHRQVMWLMVTCITVFWLWATFSHIDQQVRGGGSIIPSGQAKIIQHLEGGIVKKIFVAEGQQVEAGQPLFLISDTQAEADSSELRIQELSTLLQQRRLQAELDGKAEIDFSNLPADTPQSAIDNERQLFQSHTHNVSESIDVLQSEVLQKQLKLDDLKTQEGNLSAELKVARDQYGINEQLMQAGAISQTKYLQSKSVVQDFVTREGSIEKSIPVIQAELEESRRKIDEMKEKHRSDLIDDMRKADLALSQLRDRSKTPDDKIRRTTVASPSRGIVNKLFINTIDGVVKPGDKLAEIIPLDDKLIVEARIPTKDRGLIWQGLPAMVKLSAYDYSIYGGVPGTLKEISADTLEDEHNQPYYRVRIELLKNDLGKDMPLFPGMTADVNILSGKITIWQYLVRPLWKVRENALREAM